ncbi:MAG: hypothetical protein JJE09_16165 [Bacteroidia bacterium]|nr:hypothetical protein [Bacteroidia bacterium]
MKIENNKGFDVSTLADYKMKISSTGNNYLAEDADENNEEYTHFYFIGKYEGKDVIYDAVMYTLRLHHESELFEIAEHKAAEHFPQYKKISYNEDENGNLKPLDDLEEEIGLYMAEVILELQDEGEVRVKEHVDVDTHLDFGVGLNIGLKVEKITSKIIERFIFDFNKGALGLDDTLYSFETHQEEAE